MRGGFLRSIFGVLIKLVLLACLIFIVSNQSIRAIIQSQTDHYLYHSACDDPIHYKIGMVDPRFNLSASQFTSDVNTAAQIWDKVEGKNLFLYDPQNPKSLTVSLLYDSRQQLVSKIDTLKDQTSQADQSLESQIAQYNAEKASFEKEVDDLNKEIDDWNSKGGAPPDVFSQLNDKQSQLKQEAEKLNQEAKRLNLSTESYNSNVHRLNNTIDALNEALLKKPEEGLFDPNNNTVSIYFNNSYNELIHTLAHELGHSIGLNHNQNQLSIMYPYSTQQIAPSVDDTEALNEVCQTRVLNLPLRDEIKDKINQILNR